MTTTRPAEAGLMVVDDESSIRELPSASRRCAGFEAVTAADAVDSLEPARRTQPDQVVRDVMLPGKDVVESDIPYRRKTLGRADRRLIHTVHGAGTCCASRRRRPRD